jgi:hypothetical protein
MYNDFKDGLEQTFIKLLGLAQSSNAKQLQSKDTTTSMTDLQQFTNNIQSGGAGSEITLYTDPSNNNNKLVANSNDFNFYKDPTDTDNKIKDYTINSTYKFKEGMEDKQIDIIIKNNNK